MERKRRRLYFFIVHKVIDFVGRIITPRSWHKKSHPEGWLELKKMCVN
jgi:hypothetical protein